MHGGLVVYMEQLHACRRRLVCVWRTVLCYAAADKTETANTPFLPTPTSIDQSLANTATTTRNPSLSLPPHLANNLSINECQVLQVQAVLAVLAPTQTHTHTAAHTHTHTCACSGWGHASIQHTTQQHTQQRHGLGWVHPPDASVVPDAGWQMASAHTWTHITHPHMHVCTHPVQPHTET